MLSTPLYANDGNKGWSKSIEYLQEQEYNEFIKLRRRLQGMSILVVAQTHNGVAMAADSKETITDMYGREINYKNRSMKKIYRNERCLIGYAGLSGLTYKGNPAPVPLQPKLEKLFSNANLTTEDYTREICRMIYESDTFELFPRSVVTVCFSYKKQDNYFYNYMYRYYTDYCAIMLENNKPVISTRQSVAADWDSCGEINICNQAMKESGIVFDKNGTVENSLDFCKNAVAQTIAKAENLKRNGQIRICTVGGEIQTGILT